MSCSRAMIAADQIVALIARLERDRDAPGIGRGVERGDAQHRNDAGDVRIGADQVLDLALLALHRLEGDVGAGFRHRGDQAGVLQRQEALRHHDIEPDGGGERDQRDDQRLALMVQHPDQAAAIHIDRALDQVGEARCEAVGEDAVALLRLAVALAQQAAAHHRRQRQRDDGRGHHRDGQRQREFAEHAADQAGHEQQRDEHRDQRHGQRNHGEADFARPAQRRLQRRLAVLDVAHDVLDHHDGVVDHEAGADGQRHQRQIVEREAGKPHHAEGRDQRQRQRHAGDEGGAQRAQEDQAPPAPPGRR